MAALKPGALELVVPDPRVHLRTDDPPHDSCVTMFPRSPPRSNRFSVRDKIALQDWWSSGSRGAISRFRLEEAEPADPVEVGSFLLLYRQREAWATWGIAPRGARGFEIWSMTRGETIGCFVSLAVALEALTIAPP
jgi:hypothetical protein